MVKVMEEKINIAKILKYKPEGTKFWTDMFGSVTLYVVTDSCEAFQVKHHNKEPWFDKEGKLYKEGVLCIYPSKLMRDWSKFAWEKGDVLIRTNSEYCIGIFDEWTSDDYSTFSAKFINLGLSDNFSCSYTCKTEEWEKTENSKNYISKIERVMNGKLNLQTLEIQTQPEFKDGDIVALVVRKCTHIAIFQSRQEAYIGFHAVLCQNDELLLEEPFREDVGDIELRLATDSEKQQLFEALAKEGKCWNAEKKQIVFLKPKIELKPFDKVLSRRCSEDYWVLNFYSHKSHKTDYHICIDGSSNLYCIPYNEETAHLLGTTDDWEGGEV
nr:MAG TPA: hypothetical protein [Caudoviricetes sp.]